MLGSDGSLKKRITVHREKSTVGSSWIILNNNFDVRAGSGDDTFIISKDVSNLLINGGDGNDSVVFSPNDKNKKNKGRVINFDLFTNVERVFGTKLNDQVIGKNGVTYHYGGGKDNINLTGGQHRHSWNDFAGTFW
jgi:hypothetical protein